MAGRRPPPQRFAALWGRSVTCQLLLTRGVTTWRTHECVHHSIINERWVESRTGASADAEAPPRFPSPSRPGEFHPEPLTEPERIRTSHNPPDDVAHAPTRAVSRLGSTLRRAATQRSEPERRQEWRRGTQSACATSSPKKSGRQTGRRPFRGVESTACREGDPGRWGKLGIGRVSRSRAANGAWTVQVLAGCRVARSRAWLLPCPFCLPRFSGGSTSTSSLSRPARLLTHLSWAFIARFRPNRFPGSDARKLPSSTNNLLGWVLPPLAICASGAD